ncbi:MULTISPECIES: phage tail protein [unclassified Burkholderia]|uniref:phage tail protein n=1 Tax=unclassified Burkholderia TaxID=2613784 RepID=UPI0007526373|nr:MULTISPECIES: phage tail protein [unclassified Burkholderia]KVN11842.1 phage tail protein [Burkholderia sp. MSMB1552]KWZ50464.1 phage tail protein [Burkholderia sp. MSMB1588]
MNSLFEPAVSHRFMATFLFHIGPLPIPSPIDMRFQKVTGLSRTLETGEAYREGGNNIGQIYLPQRVTHQNLVLERGVMTVTPLTFMFDDVLGKFKSHYVDVMVVLLNEWSLPVCGWTFTKAMPVKWDTGDLDANSNAILINRLELAYREMQWIGIKA